MWPNHDPRATQILLQYRGTPQPVRIRLTLGTVCILLTVFYAVGGVVGVRANHEGGRSGAVEIIVVRTWPFSLGGRAVEEECECRWQQEGGSALGWEFELNKYNSYKKPSPSGTRRIEMVIGRRGKKN
jgi:hypothetical protein